MKIGFVGAGNMASALLNGMLSAGMTDVENVTISDADSAKLAVWKEKGVKVTSDNTEVEANSDLIVFAVKPNVIPGVLAQMKGNPDKIYISIAAGVSVGFLEEKLGSDKKIVRTMPNTPAMVSCGMTVISPNCNLSDEEREMVLRLFDSVGAAMILPEKELEIATAIHGSSPAYIYMMIDAMADAGVRYGLTKANAMKLAAKAVEGSAKMVLQTGIHPEQLKDQVCSPGGTTIAAVCELERTGFRASLQAAIDACVKRNEEMKQ
ncbi:pyrroline-5-carboxylate reductase [Ructibacterium gallinarum]|uniref:Pyrroline-5-carboxylate reductase n=1 Tax=Ructibacterium gallinarum TaxID=2779355 RepID=A0A9D5LYN5_9FIRM|nr:pyrroline-5-carboxylate reductase [Ructibacterium gallinarum]MBE5038871.1 pyrroline-5-carboxylate reductase [Ructibacterium gallinarum]